MRRLAGVTSELLVRIDACCDAMPRRHAAVEDHGPMRLFVRDGDGMQFYARPGGPDVHVTADDVAAVRARQRELDVPEEFEWIDDLVPSLGRAAEAGGLNVIRCPLLVLERPAFRDDRASVLDDESPHLAAALAIARLAFGPTGGDPTIGTTARDTATRLIEESAIAADRAAIKSGEAIIAVAGGATGPLASGRVQHDGSTAEIVGVATLPAHRRQGLAGAVTATLAAEAVARGMHPVFLSAADDAAARVYERAGFRRIGTAGLAAPPN